MLVLSQHSSEIFLCCVGPRLNDAGFGVEYRGRTVAARFWRSLSLDKAGVQLRLLSTFFVVYIHLLAEGQFWFS